MRKAVLVSLFWLSFSRLYAQHTQLPQIPLGVYSIANFGAIGDGKTLNTNAIQHALDSCRAKGGEVIVPEGIFICGPISIYSKTHLRLSKGAVLRLTNEIDSFPVKGSRYLNFIQVSNATDIKISGEGIIDGQGKIWWQKYDAKLLTNRRPQMLFIENSEKIEVDGVTFLNPPNTHFSLKNVREVYIHNITIQAPEDSHNTDGINISAQNCTIEKCTINTGDDNIAINFGNNNPNSAENPECINITIKDCVFGYGHGLSIGSYTSGGLKNLKVSNCKFDGTTSAIRIKTARGRGGVVQDVSYNDIQIANCRWPIFISEYYPREPLSPADDSLPAMTGKTPVYKNISLKNITVTNADEAIKVWGLPESPINGLSFESIQIDATKGATINNAKNVVFKSSTIKVKKGDRMKLYQADVKE